jgi:hypothetical protein
MRPAAAAILLAALAIPSASARPGFFWTTSQGSFLAVDYLVFSTSDFEGSDGDVGGERSQLSGQYEFAGDAGWVLGLGHEYNALDIDEGSGAAPRTNGDLHTLHLATGWQTQPGEGQLSLALAPALSVSSNGLKNPDELDSDALQLWGAAIYTWPGSRHSWILGAAHDYRFGESRVYPVIGFEMGDEKTVLRLTYPDLVLSTTLGYGWEVEFVTSPDGNEWLAYDRSMEYQDEFRREAWESAIRLGYRFDNGLLIGMAAGYHWNQEWQYRREDGSVARHEGGDSPFYGIHMGWYRR